MSSETVQIGGSRPAQAASAWLYNPTVDVLFGYGLAYLVSVPLLLVAAQTLDPSSAPIWITGLLALLFSTPHYGATILRVYEQRGDRRKYTLFAVWITLVLVALFGVGLFDARVGSLLLTIYVSWSPWHFSGQNYGLAVMYLRRRGVAVEPEIKRPLYASFVLSAVLAFVSIHMAGRGLSFAAGSDDVSGTFAVYQIGIPNGWASAIGALLAIAFLSCLGSVLQGLRGRLSAAQLAPLGLIVLTQSLWFGIPALGATTSLYSLSGYELPFLAIWISSAHAVQYLWVTCYYARRSESGTSVVPFLGKAMLAGGALALPGLLFAPALLGAYAPNSAGVGVLVFTLVNLHHFVLDGAIWKLRDGRVARALLRSETLDDAPLASGGFLKPLLWTLGGVAVLVQVQLLYVAHAVAAEDVSLRVLRFASTQLTWLGRDTPELWAKIGIRSEEAQEDAAAIRAYRRSVEQDPAPAPWMANRLAWLLLEHERGNPASVREATRLATYLTKALGPRRVEGYQTLAEAQAAAGEYSRAVVTAERALQVARAVGADRRAAHIEARLADYRTRSQPAETAPAP